jgi:tellurite resistance protein
MDDLDQARCVVELMVLTAWADGHVEGSEALTIHRLVTTIPQLTKAKLEERGLEACVREAAAAIVDPKFRELAFQCCAKVSGADGDFVPEEAAVLAQLQSLFGYSAEDVKRLLVLATK